MVDVIKQMGQTLKQARLSSGITQERLGEQVGVSGRYIMTLENEQKTPSFEALCALIHALNIPADNIFYPKTHTTENQKEQLIRLLTLCSDHDIEVRTATAKALIEPKYDGHLLFGGWSFLYPPPYLFFLCEQQTASAAILPPALFLMDGSTSGETVLFSAIIKAFWCGFESQTASEWLKRHPQN